MTRKLLPIGIQTFSRLREDDAYYVDKTRLLLSLIRGEPIHLVAVEFSANERNVVGFEVEAA